MVASDTLVGLIGAGILLVALAGVFVFESRQTDVEKDLAAAEYAIAFDGELDFEAFGTPALVGGGCVPPNPCGNTAQLILNLTDAPLLPASQTNLRYWAFLTGGASNVVFGSFQFQNGAYRIDSDAEATVPNSDDLVVSLEHTANPTGPSSVVLLRRNNQGSGGEVTGNADVQWGEGEGMASLAETDQGLQVDITITGARNHSGSGFSYRAWLHSEADNNYRFLGNLTQAGANTTLSVGVSGASLDSFDNVFVTIEPTASRPPTAGNEAGGPVAYRMRIGDDPVPTIPR